VGVIDGQALRLGISRDLGFSAEERSENLRRGAEIARRFNDAGLLCIAAFVAFGTYAAISTAATLCLGTGIDTVKAGGLCLHGGIGQEGCGEH
jgi:bifunctional enzyme CysN/CysC